MEKYLKGKTAAGFEFKIDWDALNDMELVEEIAEIDENPLKLPSVIKSILGEAQKNALYEHYRAENGRVPVDVISQALVEIMSVNNQGKN